MGHIVILILLISIFNLITSQETKNNTKCYLTGFEKQDPFPSLIKCFKYNSDACCTSVHDDYIQNFIGSLLTSSCARKYSELENLYCYGCNPKEPSYTNLETKTISICLSFAMRIWNVTTVEELKKPTTRFDNCGFKVNSDSTHGLKEVSKGKPYVIPSEAFKDFDDFLVKIGIPLFDEFKVELFNDLDSNLEDTNNLPICYGSGEYFKASFLIISLLIFTLLF